MSVNILFVKSSANGVIQRFTKITYLLKITSLLGWRVSLGRRGVLPLRRGVLPLRRRVLPLGWWIST